MTLRTKACENFLCTNGCRTVCCIKSNIQSVKSYIRNSNNMLNIILNSGFTVHPVSYLAADFKFGFLRIIKNNSFNFFFGFIRKFIAVSLKNFNPIILTGIMRCRNHNACITIILSDKISNRRSRHNAN